MDMQEVKLEEALDRLLDGITEIKTGKLTIAINDNDTDVELEVEGLGTLLFMYGVAHATILNALTKDGKGMDDITAGTLMKQTRMNALEMISPQVSEE